MKIAIYSDNFYPELSGISDSLIALARELAGRGHFIHFFVPRYSKEDHTLSNMEHGELDLGRTSPSPASPPFISAPARAKDGSSSR